jgi:hypothetical protein
MNKIYTILLSLIIALNLQAQEEGDTTRVNFGKKNIVTITEDDEGSKVNVNEDFVIVDETDDTVKVKLGNKAITIIENGDNTHVEIIQEKDFHKHGWRKKPQRFTGHWAGFELGLNNWIDDGGQFAGTKPENQFLDLNTGKSWEFDLNFMQYSLPFGKPVGMVTGMGFKRNNYWFNGNNNIMKDPITGIIIERPAPFGISYTKSKLNTWYLTVPLLIEFQFGPEKKGFVSLGVIGDLKVYSNTKLKYYEGGSKQKEKGKSDYNLSPFRYHLNARAGYGFIKIFANYSMVRMFKLDKGPEVYPVTIGLTLISFR